MGFAVIGYGQIPSYYDDTNLSLSGQSLKNELTTLVTNTQTTILSYTPGVWDALKVADADPANANNVILLYGWEGGSDSDLTNDRSRDKDSNGGSNGDWNREHSFPKSLGNPNLGETGPGSDAHHLRPTDVQRNSSRGSRKFADGSGNSGTTSQGYWYPGDEWKGDVARMMMFMYVRYGSRCLPIDVGVGSSVSTDSDMIDLFLEWNAEDPVSALEIQRNPIIENIQGNRNPFIDNPAFATQIWGGPQAEDLFGDTGGGGGNNTLCSTTISSFPYSQSFENTFGSWKQASSGDDFNWATRSGSTPSSSTGPSAAEAGSYYIYMESSSPNYSSKRAILYSPCYNLSSANQATFSFNYHMYGATTMGSLALEVSLNGTSWTSIWSASGNKGNSWQTASVNLGAYLGETIQLRFNGVTGTTWQGDMAIDNISLSTSGNTGGGSTPGNITLSITFDQYASETSWEILDDSNQVVYSGDSYDDQTNGSSIDLSGPLDAGCYTLVFRDSYGDGICCSHGNGSYVLSDTSTGTVLTSGGSFGSQDSKNFCIGTGAREFTQATTDTKIAVSRGFDFTLYPSPATDVITIQMVEPMDEASYTIINHVGQIVKSGFVSKEAIQLDNIASGMYFLQIKTGTKTSTKKFAKK
ncbi:hypothetical protein GCM10022393_38040 [Aquimarina addita]|uniref:MAM domain-containing protein n=2 Tax=Aquimarina addita TaxID=870485 RepID=A0ABP6US12_9FLAO